MNRKYGHDSFFLFHRARLWNAREHCWMGYERKRGKLAALNALLRGGAQDFFAFVVGGTRVLGDVRYVIPLDTDTQLPRGAARHLVPALGQPAGGEAAATWTRWEVEKTGVRPWSSACRARTLVTAPAFPRRR